MQSAFIDAQTAASFKGSTDGLWRARRVAGRKAPQIRRIDRRTAPDGGISLRPICSPTRRLISADTTAAMKSRSTAIDSCSFHRRNARRVASFGRRTNVRSVPSSRRTTRRRPSTRTHQIRVDDVGRISCFNQIPFDTSATSIFSDSTRGRRRLNRPFRRLPLVDLMQLNA
jgi:hypothetical protein